MDTNSHTRAHRGWQSGVAALSTLTLTAMISLSGATPAQGGALDSDSLRDQADIAALEYCYADATDAIGRGNIELGRQIYRRCFTADAVIEASMPSADPNAPPTYTAIGPDEWTDNVAVALASYVSTQHMITNIQVDAQLFSGTSRSYLNATHVIDPTGSVDIANGTYVNQVVRTPFGWKIKQRSLRLITFYRVESP